MDDYLSFDEDYSVLADVPLKHRDKIKNLLMHEDLEDFYFKGFEDPYVFKGKLTIGKKDLRKKEKPNAHHKKQHPNTIGGRKDDEEEGNAPQEI